MAYTVEIEAPRHVTAAEITQEMFLPPGAALRHIIEADGTELDPGPQPVPPPVVLCNGVAGIAVVITCHAPYLECVMRQVRAVDAQSVRPAEKILVLDGCEPPAGLPPDWQVIRGKWRSPNPGRNAACAKTSLGWLIFADADDEMDRDYVAACWSIIQGAGQVVHRLGIVYNDLAYTDGQRLVTPPVFDYWALRRKNYISAASCWSVCAIREAGGWPMDTACYDDYSLALAITARGWQAIKGPGLIRVDCRAAGHRRHQAGDKRQFMHLWNHRTYAMVTLFAGRAEHLAAWQDWLLHAHLPRTFRLYLVDNSRNPDFSRLLRHRVSEMVSDGQEVVLITDTRAPDNSLSGRHAHVAHLYNAVLPRVQEDFVLMLEDDVVPPYDGLHRLVEAWEYKDRPAGIGGVYLSRHNRDNGGQRIVASRHSQFWTGVIHRDEVSEDQLYEFNQIAGGFTLWNNGYVRPCLPCRLDWFRPGIPRGWDSNLSLACKALGGRLFLHGGVQCDHRYQ